jgi:hypothetical protein
LVSEPNLWQGPGPVYSKDDVISALNTYNSLVASSDRVNSSDFCEKIGSTPLRQRDLTSRIHKRVFDLLLLDHSLSHSDLVRIKEQTLAGSSSWMMPAYVGSKSVIDPNLFALLLKRHLGMQFFDPSLVPLTRCPKWQLPFASQRSPCASLQDAHLHHSTEHCNTMFAHRHNVLAHTLRRLCNRSGIQSLAEVACLPGSSEVPADVYIHMGPQDIPVAVDVSIASPITEELVVVRSIKKAPGVCLSNRERDKEAKYLSSFRAMNGRIQFCPFVMSTFCGLGVQARRLAMFISSKLADRWCIPEQLAKTYVFSHLTSSLMQFIAVSLMHAVAMVPSRAL